MVVTSRESLQYCNVLIATVVSEYEDEERIHIHAYFHINSIDFSKNRNV